MASTSKSVISRKRQRCTSTSILPGIYVLGKNEDGQLGLPSRVEEKLYPSLLRSMANKEIVGLASGGLHTVALTRDSEVWTWGLNDNGALGRPTPEAKDFTPGKVISPFKFGLVDAGDSHVVALDKSRNVWIWGTYRDSNGNFSLIPGHGNTGVERPVMLNVGLQPSSFIVQIRSGDNHIVLLTSDGEVFTAGSEYQFLGRRRNPTDQAFPTDNLTPRPIQGTNGEIFNEIWAGGDSTICKTSTGEFWVFGINSRGKLAIEGLGNDRPPDIVEVPIRSPLITEQSFTQIAIGQFHCLGLKQGKVYSWGRGADGQLGLGDNITQDIAKPTLIATIQEPISKIFAGGRVSYALNTNGQVYAWGCGVNGQLGNGYNEEQFTPALVKIFNMNDGISSLTDMPQVTLIAANTQHTIFIVEDESVVEDIPEAQTEPPFLHFVLNYIPKGHRLSLRTVSKHWKKVVDSSVPILFRLCLETWDIVQSTGSKPSEVNLIDFTPPLFSRPIGFIQNLQEITFTRISTIANIHYILSYCNQIRSLTFSTVVIDARLKYNHANPIVLPYLNTLRLQTIGSSLSIDEEMLLDFLSKITYNQLQKFYIWYSMEPVNLAGLKLHCIWNFYDPLLTSSVADLIDKNKETLEIFICGKPASPNLLRFYKSSNQLSTLSCQTRCPIAWDSMLLQQFKLQYIELTKIPFDLWCATLNSIRNSGRTLAYVKLIGDKSNERNSCQDLDLTMFSGHQQLRHLEINMNFPRVIGVTDLPKTLQYLSLKGQMNKFEIYSIASHLQNLEYLHLDLDEDIRNTLQLNHFDPRYNDYNYMTFVDAPLLKELVSLAKLRRLILKNCIGNFHCLSLWLDNKENSGVELAAEIRTKNGQHTYGDIDITLYPQV